MTLNTAEAFGLAVVVAFTYGMWRLADWLGATISWWPW